VLAPACATATSPAPSDESPSAAPALVDDVEPAVVTAPTDPDPTPNPEPNAAGTIPFNAFPMPTNCQAKLALTEEVSRLLTRAAAHATRSNACVDGPGVRVAATDVLVCPAAGNGSDLVVSAFYRMARYPEGDTRGCGTGGRDCSWLTPTVSEHRAELRFETDGKGRARLRVPATLPGMDDGTPLDQAHDGKCYGNSPAFEALWVQP